MADFNNIKFEPHIQIGFGKKRSTKVQQHSAILSEGNENDISENEFNGFEKAIENKGDKNKISKNKFRR